MIKRKHKVIEQKNKDAQKKVINREKININKIVSPALLFITIALALLIGYIAGGYKYQIVSFVGQMFGYKKYVKVIDLSSVEKTYNILASKYDGDLDIDLLIEGANRGLVRAVGDTYTTYMNAEETQEYSDSIDGNIGGGIGVVVGLKNDNVTILQVLKDNPAIKVGLLPNDIILEINDQSISGWSVDKAVTQIRGEEGTTVKLIIRRDQEIMSFVVTRAIINNPSVSSEIKEGVGIMTITRFDDTTSSLARIAARGFIKENVKSVILDLRDNTGGYVTSAVGVASLWINNKTVATERAGDVITETLMPSGEAILDNIPTVVLINYNTASASEIVAGALQDYKIAKIVGDQSFGKGSVQQLIKLDGGAQLKVTVARWYTPNGRNIGKDGVTPDIHIVLTQADVDAGVDPQIDKAIEVLGL